MFHSEISVISVFLSFLFSFCIFHISLFCFCTFSFFSCIPDKNMLKYSCIRNMGAKNQALAKSDGQIEKLMLFCYLFKLWLVIFNRKKQHVFPVLGTRNRTYCFFTFLMYIKIAIQLSAFQMNANSIEEMLLCNPKSKLMYANTSAFLFSVNLFQYLFLAIMLICSRQAYARLISHPFY